MAKVYAAQILGELDRLHASLETCAKELELQEGRYEKLKFAYERREHEFNVLEQEVIEAREEWDATRADLERRLEEAETRAA